MAVFSYMYLSTAHLTQDTMTLLQTLTEQQRRALEWPAMTVAGYEGGAFVSVPDIECTSLLALPTDLEFILRLAYDDGAYLVRFDADGYTDPSLPNFDGE